MSTERDILAGRINAAIEEWDEAEPGKYAAHVAGHIADAILAAGYRKPRTITTLEDLDALPHGSVVLNGLYEAVSKHGEWWFFPAIRHRFQPTSVALPAIVLHEGNAK